MFCGLLMIYIHQEIFLSSQFSLKYVVCDMLKKLWLFFDIVYTIIDTNFQCCPIGSEAFENI